MYDLSEDILGNCVAGNYSGIQRLFRWKSNSARKLKHKVINRWYTYCFRNFDFAKEHNFQKYVTGKKLLLRDDIE